MKLLFSSTLAAILAVTTLVGAVPLGKAGNPSSVDATAIEYGRDVAPTAQKIGWDWRRELSSEALDTAAVKSEFGRREVAVEGDTGWGGRDLPVHVSSVEDSIIWDRAAERRAENGVPRRKLDSRGVHPPVVNIGWGRKGYVADAQV